MDQRGTLAAVAAFLAWGVSGLYYHQFQTLPAAEVLSHRVLWSVLLTGALVAAGGHGGRVVAALGHLRSLGLLALSALMISLNWAGFIWAVGHGRALEASMGYYLFPLATVVLGRWVLDERPTRRQWAAVAVVAAGVAVLVASVGAVPWIALMLASTFALYGLIRKMAPVDALVGLFVECLLTTPLAVGYLVFAHGGAVGAGQLATGLLLTLAGPYTALPLLCFAFAARRMKLSTLGLMQYMNPTCQMLVAVLAFGEPFTLAYGVTFAAIWGGLALYSLGAPGRNRGTA